MMICPACHQPILPGSLATPVIYIDDDGDPMKGDLDFTHQHVIARKIGVTRVTVRAWLGKR